ncbi:MAG TPA: LytTR family DNA-binding domain-containing protein [Jatrophihabitans sp.]|nr:LytTR family DNA-binding domain-containing protein [Jatrophihabitans sp.]
MSVGSEPGDGPHLAALVVDDEAPAREELAFLLREDPRVGPVRTAGSAAQALRVLGEQRVDVVFCDIKMPGLDGVELARIVSRFAERPRIVFVTAYDDRAVDAFELAATDYVMKPVRADRLGEAVRRVVTAEHADTPADEDESIPVELAGVTRFVRRSQVRYVEAHGDYARLHTATEAHLLRCPLAELEERWADAGFVRIHRSTLVALAHIDEVRVVEGHYTVRLGNDELAVSRRHTRELRDRLVQR